MNGHPNAAFLVTVLAYAAFAAASFILAAEEQSLFTFTQADTDRSSIEIHAGTTAPKPIPDFLFGKFTEHLGFNIYNGMWAQVLKNPEFAPAETLGRDIEKGHWLRQMDRRPEYRGIVDAVSRKVALYWLPFGQGEVTFSFDSDAVSPPSAQKMEVKSISSPPYGAQVGLTQPIFLPLHRQQNYELSFWAKAKNFDGTVTFTVRPRSSSDTLAQAASPRLTEDWQPYKMKMKIEPAERGAPLDFIISIDRPGTLWLDHVCLVPKDNAAGFDPDVIAYLKASHLPLLRWPGGNFSSGYHWQNGIGPVERRPTLQNPAWRNALEYNHVGTDEFIAFCRIVGCEPLICANAGDGTPEEAARWVEYCNGDADTTYGAIRAANGHPKPYNITYWEIGNELYGKWQIGHCSAEEYPGRYRRFHEAMRAADPRIKFIACGHTPEWNAQLVEKVPGILRSVSLHTLFGSNLNRACDPRETFETLMAYTWHYDGLLHTLAGQMTPAIPAPRIAVTELQIFVFAPGYPTNQTMAEALFFSGILHSCIRQGDLVEMITHSALVNHGGGLRKAREIVYPNPVHWAHHLYANQPGRFPVRLDVACPTFSVPKRTSPAVEAVPYLDCLALLDESGKTLSLIVANRHPEKPLPASILLHDFQPQPDVNVSQIAPESFVSSNTWQNSGNVRLIELRESADGPRLDYTFPPPSLTALKFARKPL